MEQTLKSMDLRILSSCKDVKFLFFPKININLGLERVWLHKKEVYLIIMQFKGKIHQSVRFNFLIHKL